MKSSLLPISALLFFILFTSCESTRVYVKSQSLFYDDDKLVEESGNVKRIDYKDKSAKEIKKQKNVEDYTKYYYDFSDLYEASDSSDSNHSISVVRYQTTKKKYETITFTLEEAPSATSVNKEPLVLGQKTVKFKKGKVSKPKKTGRFSEEDEALYQKASAQVFAKLKEAPEQITEETEISAGKLKTENCTERITVESKTNGKYVVYTFLGKPFVLLGASAWNVIKCGGYAFINFFGGWSFAHGSEEPFWMMPSYTESKNNADAAKEAKRIKYYPEYHVPLTNNHISVDKYNREVEVEKLFAEGTEQITAVEHHEYDNTMSVSLSAKADAVSTAANAELVGTVITIPVSGASWVFGVVAGLAEQMR